MSEGDKDKAGSGGGGPLSHCSGNAERTGWRHSEPGEWEPPEFKEVELTRVRSQGQGVRTPFLAPGGSWCQSSFSLHPSLTEVGPGVGSVLVLGFGEGGSPLTNTRIGWGPSPVRAVGRGLEGNRARARYKLGEIVVGLGVTQCTQVPLPELEPVRFPAIHT